MKLIAKLVPKLAKDLVEALIENEDIEVEPKNKEEAYKDFAGILNEYIRLEREITEEAKDVLAKRGFGMSRFSEAKKMAAQARKVPLGDDALDYVLNQILEFLLISKNIEEVYAEDHVMRKRMVGFIRKHLNVNEELDQEVRRRIKNVQEGTRDWEIAYQRTLEQVRRAKGL